MFRSKVLSITATLVLTLALGMFLSGCDTTTEDNSVPATTEISISASPTVVLANQTSVVEAYVVAGGSAVADQAVQFTVTPSNAGYFTPEIDTTDATGTAAVIFTASEVGGAVITATIVGTTHAANVSMSISDAGGGGGGGTTTGGDIDLSLSRSLLVANGEDTTIATIVVRDALGQPAPDSTLVKLCAGERFDDLDGNGYWTAGVDTLIVDANNNDNWDGIGFIPAAAYTQGGTGVATVNYVSGDNAGTAYLRATVDEEGLVGYDQVTVQLQPNTELHSIYLASDSVSLSVRHTGGIETSYLRAFGYDINGNPVPEGVRIVFTILDGPAGGEQLSTVGYGPDTVYTNGQGVATTTVHSGTASGTIRIRAFSDTVLSNAAQVLVAAGPAVDISVGSENCNVPYWDDVNGPNNIVALVSDVYNNPVNDSTVVYFTTDEGVVLSHQQRTQGGTGVATSQWLSNGVETTGDGVVWIYAETSGGTVLDSCVFINSHVPDTLIVTGMPATILADGNSEATIVVSGIDLNGNYVIGGTAFESDANFLAVPGGTLEDGCYSAAARIKIASKTLDLDYSLTGGNDDGIGAVDFVQFWYGATAYTAFNVQMLTGPAYTGSSSLNGEASAAPGGVLQFSAVIRDRWGNPLGDHTLNMTASGGVVAGGSQETNAYGEAFGFSWTAPGVEGDYEIVLTDTDARGGIVLTKSVSVSAAK